MSGFGDSGSPQTQQYDNMFNSWTSQDTNLPQYQYVAYAAKKGGSCTADKFSRDDIQNQLVTYRPNSPDRYIHQPLVYDILCNALNCLLYVYKLSFRNQVRRLD